MEEKSIVEKKDSYDIRKTQMVELDILVEFDRVCKKNNLSYFLDSGTALGAVRHGGFIPWDDDIDVGMLREDYDRFIKYAYKDLGDDYFLQTLETDPGCPCLFAKIRKNGTCFLENNKEGMQMHTGIWIDIFPFDSITDDSIAQIAITHKVERLLHAYYIKKIPHKERNNGKNPIRYVAEAFIRKVLHVLLKFVKESFFTSRINRIIEENVKYDKYVTCYYYIAYNGANNPIVFEKDRLLPLSSIGFESNSFGAVKDIDYYLQVLYGDYMQLPPEEKRVGHRPLFITYGNSVE